ncbi:ABC transporter permease, partial [bacterium]|nr:ABC transporter permease [bacterium]
IYRVLIKTEFHETGRSAVTLRSLAGSIIDMYPEVESVCRIYEPSKSVMGPEQHRSIEKGVFFVDASFFDIFPLSFNIGIADSPLKEKNSIVLTPALAIKYFGDTNPVGQTLIYGDDIPLTVTAVLQELPMNFHLQFNALVSFTTLLKPNSNPWQYQCMSYLKMQNGCSPSELEAKMAEDKVALNPNFIGGVLTYLEPLHAVHFSPVPVHSSFVLQQDKSLITLLLFIAAFILILASINHVNLSTARSMIRAREVGVRKMLGAGRTSLIGQFVGESAFFIAIAFGAAGFAAAVFHPAFQYLIGSTFPLTWILQPSMLLSLLGVYCLTVLFSCGYSSVVLSGFQPSKVLRSIKVPKSSGGKFIKWLIFLQFTITLIFMIGTGVVYQQMSFILNRPLGYNKSNLLIIDARHPDCKDNVQHIKNEWNQLPEIESVSFTSGGPLIGTMYSMKEIDDQKIRIHKIYVDEDFIKTLGLQLVEGRSFEPAHSTDKDGVILNEAYVRIMNRENFKDEQCIIAGKPTRILGVISDFHLSSLYSPIEPLVVKAASKMCKKFYIRIKPDAGETVIQDIRAIWEKHVPFSPLEFSYAEDSYKQKYIFENRLLNALTIFAGICIFICCLGLLGLTISILENRIKEIGIRRILGGSGFSVWQLVVEQFVGWIALSMVIAFPAAFLLMGQWLEQFAYRTDWNFFVFGGAGILVLMIAILTISLQVVYTIRQNPVRVLRHE